MTKELHRKGVEILEALGLDYVHLERQPDGQYRYHAWSEPLVWSNGSPGKTKRGKIRL